MMCNCFSIERVVVECYNHFSVYSFEDGMQMLHSARCFFQYQLFTMLHGQFCKPLNVKGRQQIFIERIVFDIVEVRNVVLLDLHIILNVDSKDTGYILLVTSECLRYDFAIIQRRIFPMMIYLF